MNDGWMTLIGLIMIIALGVFIAREFMRWGG